MNPPSNPLRRRQVLLRLAASSVATPLAVRAQAGPKLRIGYWPIAAGLRFHAAPELGYFKQAVLDVEPQRFAGAQQVMEAVLSGRAEGTSNGTGFIAAKKRSLEIFQREVRR